MSKKVISINKGKYRELTTFYGISRAIQQCDTPVVVVNDYEDLKLLNINPTKIKTDIRLTDEYKQWHYNRYGRLPFQCLSIDIPYGKKYELKQHAIKLGYYFDTMQSHRKPHHLILTDKGECFSLYNPNINSECKFLRVSYSDFLNETRFDKSLEGLSDKQLWNLRAGTQDPRMQKLIQFNKDRMNDVFVGKSLSEEELNDLFREE